MRFALSPEQEAFAASLDALLSTLDCDTATRAWGAGDHGPGLKIWRRLADQGLTALTTPSHRGGLAEEDGTGATTVDAVLAFEVLGRFCPPGPWTDSAVLPCLLDDEILASAAAGETLVSLAFPPYLPFALDADIADARFLVDGTSLRGFTPGTPLTSLDSSRRLFEPVPGDELGPALDPARAFDLGALLTAAQLLGAGRHLLEMSVAYAGQRRQYGREIGRFQAIKHLLAEVVTALELARPLLHGAAVTAEPADVSAAKVACGDAAHLAARTALQVHGAIGYTAEHPLGLRLTRIRALTSAWGTPAVHRHRVLAAIAP
ncbi:acyl-CoA dehydrogenase family protein [Amycolatopsis saalfeldensis]|uniref:Acyl-CoA dehydrogenase/oxidase C-terminal domain-containing protein n=1 Tax=Amycolatopsis saalfeldensis TaxID=394193 RepID=A0A1H8X564_9PSEU|nr:acyl-CoA dehydrogenase family protein [Amycolatopsis saalfeldensis]SEP35095.1 hypothetical protein SAMN04489732_106302 [Amycolatopsis saalfeldensis]